MNKSNKCRLPATENSPFSHSPSERMKFNPLDDGGKRDFSAFAQIQSAVNTGLCLTKNKPGTASTIIFFSLVVFFAVAAPGNAEARQRITVPANVGVGPAGIMPFGPLFEDQPLHLGLKIWIGAVIDQETIRENIRMVPRQYQSYARQLDEYRHRAHFLIPDSLILSPNLFGTGMVGATWRLMSAGIRLLRTDDFQLGLSAGLIGTYAFIWSDTLSARFTHFLRPGIDIKAEAEVKIHSALYLSFGWTSQLHIPQEPGSNPFTVEQELLDDLPGSLNRTISHFGQPFIMFHYRFPYEAAVPGR